MGGADNEEVAWFYTFICYTLILRQQVPHRRKKE